MKNFLIVTVSLINIFCSVYVRGDHKIQKILTNDYGILLQKSNSSNHKIFKRVINMPNKLSPEIYWQCFPRQKVSVTLTELEDRDDIAKESYSLISISAEDVGGNLHEYVMRRAWPLSTYKDRYNRWEFLMKNEKFVCIAGSFTEIESDDLKDQKYQKATVYLWLFEKIKNQGRLRFIF